MKRSLKDPQQGDLFSASSEAPPANPSALQDLEEDWVMTVVTWPSDSVRLLSTSSPPGSFGKMCQGYSAATEDGTLVPSSGRWSSAGMGSPTAFSMLNISESHNGGDASFLSDILETGVLPRRYYLSERACSGILKRARKRGKKLPPMLETALRSVRATDGGENPEASHKVSERMEAT